MAAALRILHLNDRLSDRGGADQHLDGVIHHQVNKHEVFLGVGAMDPGIDPPCASFVVEGLDDRESAPTRLDELYSRIAPNIIHLHNIMNPTALEWATKKGAIITVQDHRFFCPGQGKWTLHGEVCTDTMDKNLCGTCFEDQGYYEKIYSLSHQRLHWVRQMHRVVVLSNYMREELERAGVPRDRLEVIPPFVHGLAPATSSPGAYLLIVGRLVETKGFADAVEAWRRSDIDLPLVVAGAGRARGQVEGEGIEYVGWVGREELSALYANAAVVVLSPRWQEPFGIVGLEALHCGTPVVAWESGGVRDWYRGEKIPWGDIDTLGAAMGRALGQEVSPDPRFAAAPLMRKLEALYRRDR